MGTHTLLTTQQANAVVATSTAARTASLAAIAKTGGKVADNRPKAREALGLFEDVATPTPTTAPR